MINLCSKDFENAGSKLWYAERKVIKKKWWVYSGRPFQSSKSEKNLRKGHTESTALGRRTLATAGTQENTENKRSAKL